MAKKRKLVAPQHASDELNLPSLDLGPADNLLSDEPTKKPIILNDDLECIYIDPPPKEVRRSPLL